MISHTLKLQNLIFNSSPNKALTFIHGLAKNSKLSDLDILVSNVPIGSDVEKVVKSLTSDNNCRRIFLTHQLFDELLERFKDDWKSALGVFRWAQSRPDFEHSSEGYDQMLDILGKMREMERMNLLLREMHNCDMVTIESIAKVMRRFSGAGQCEEAIKLFDELGSFGLKKNTDSMNVLLDSLCKGNRVNKAREIFLELKPHIMPNANTFNILIHGWCKVGRVEEAYWTVQEMKGNGFNPCVISYSIIVKFYCKKGDFDGMYRVLDEMRSVSCAPNVVTYTILMSCLAKVARFDEALQIAERAKLDKCKPDVLFFNSLIHALGRSGKLGEAIRVFEVEMVENKIVPNTSTYNTLIAMFCQRLEEKKALNLLSKMENSGVCKPDVLTYYPLLKFCFRTGKTDDLLTRLLDDMVKKHHLSLDLSAYSLLIHGLSRANKCEWAFLLFEEMISHGLKPRNKTCRLLFKVVSDKNLRDFADKIEDYMKSMKLSLKDNKLRY